MKPGTMVAVTWMDAHADDGHDVDVDQQIGIRCTTVGLVVRQTKKGIVVALDHSELDQYRMALAIPAGMIEKIERLRRV